jgi:hypothetical protein
MPSTQQKLYYRHDTRFIPPWVGNAGGRLYRMHKAKWLFPIRGPHRQVFICGVEIRGPHRQVFICGVEVKATLHDVGDVNK